MKNSFLSFAILASAASASAQPSYSSITPPTIFRCFTNEPGNAFVANGGGAAPGPSTNLAGLPVRLAFPIYEGGYGMQIVCAGTNATTTTNLTITIEYSADGENWITNLTTTWVVTPLGVQYAPCATNNPQTEAGGVMGNFALGRIKSIHHTNTASVFITNLVAATRPILRPKRK